VAFNDLYKQALAPNSCSLISCCMLRSCCLGRSSSQQDALSTAGRKESALDFLQLQLLPCPPQPSTPHFILGPSRTPALSPVLPCPSPGRQARRRVCPGGQEHLCFTPQLQGLPLSLYLSGTLSQSVVSSFA
jgi:hypothetical protein